MSKNQFGKELRLYLTPGFFDSDGRYKDDTVGAVLECFFLDVV